MIKYVLAQMTQLEDQQQVNKDLNQRLRDQDVDQISRLENNVRKNTEVNVVQLTDLQ